MMNSVWIDKTTKIALKTQDVIGVGGEGTIFKVMLAQSLPIATKIYHQPNQRKAQKLKELIQLNLSDLSEIVSPLKLVWDSSSKVVGFTMKLLSSGQQALDFLSVRKYREANSISTKDIMEIFIKLHKVLTELHQRGVIVGDLNPLNILFKKTEIALIDADSFQFGSYPCEVATERCLNPRLYGVNLSLKPAFRQEDDWYAFLVLFFSSLLLVHPYGGVHPSIRTLTKRAQGKITVLDKSVIYPKIAYSPDLVPKELKDIFLKTFAEHQSVSLNRDLLEEFKTDLIKCSTCDFYYPKYLKNCPGCTAKNQQIQQLRIQVKGVRMFEFLSTQGPIIFFKIIGKDIYAIANEEGRPVLYIRNRLGNTRKVLVSKDRLTVESRFDVFDKYLLYCQNAYDDEPLIDVLDISGTSIQKLGQTVTNRFGDRGAVFRGNAKYFYRTIGGSLLRCSLQLGHMIVDELVNTVMNKQTWFDVDVDAERELIFGFDRVIKDYKWFLIKNGSQADIDISPLDQGESMIDRTIRFSSSSILLLRRTVKNGKDYCRLDLIDNQLNRVKITKKFEVIDKPHFGNIHVCAYARGVILIPSDDGLIAESIDNESQKKFPATANYVNADSQLWPYENGIVVVSGEKVLHLIMD